MTAKEVKRLRKWQHKMENRYADGRIPVPIMQIVAIVEVAIQLAKLRFAITERHQ